MSIMAHKYMNVVSVKKNGFNNSKTNKIMKKETREFVYWLMDNCKLIKDEETDENELWRYESEDYSVDGLFEIFVEEKFKNK
jgi:exopolysaccharide biosynthesis protein